MRVFNRARWRLALWFAGVLALILATLGGAVYLTARAVLFDQVNDDLRARSSLEVRPLTNRLLEMAGRGQAPSGIAIGPAFTAGGYFYALVDDSGTILASTPNTDPAGLVKAEVLQNVWQTGATFVDTDSSSGENLRVHVLPINILRGQSLFLEVGRSTEPERQALRRLFFILAAGGGAGLALAVGGGLFLSGRALAPIKTAMDRQQAFVADASHELRTPLSIIRANAELLKRHPSEPVQSNEASVDDIIQETDRLGSLVSQLLTLARADANQADLVMAEVDLRPLTADAVRQMRLLAEPKEITIDFQTDGTVITRGDPIRLREMVEILLDNAVKYSHRGSSVRVTLRPSGDKALLQVSDTGPGIPPEALPHIFERFYRVDKARSREMGGAGLGLSIAKWIVEAHRGEIRVSSAPGVGSTVTVELPTLPRGAG